jgi:uncharacterized protein (TIGR02246 family)
MKKMALLLLLTVTSVVSVYSQSADTEQKAIAALIDQYSQARDKSDTVLLKSILTTDIDQLVSNGEWRKGIRSAVDGMLRSSGNNPGKRILQIESTRMLSPTSAIVDCRYETENTNGTTRKMWSAFIAVIEKGKWKICAIRNMLPAAQ